MDHDTRIPAKRNLLVTSSRNQIDFNSDVGEREEKHCAVLGWPEYSTTLQTECFWAKPGLFKVLDDYITMGCPPRESGGLGHVSEHASIILTFYERLTMSWRTAVLKSLQGVESP